jgi:hypothetical protein
MNIFSKTSAIVLVAGIMTVPAIAHHSFSMFDMTKDVVLQGDVKEFQWTNPHIWVQVLVKDAEGKPAEWSIEGGSPSILSRQGWSKRSLKAGDTVTLTVHPMRDGSLGGSLVKVVLADGTVVGDP